jgi:hypothetical protein
MDEQTNESMNGWMDRWMDGKKWSFHHLLGSV